MQCKYETSTININIGIYEKISIFKMNKKKMINGNKIDTEILLM